jgi:hypothetical protein
VSNALCAIRRREPDTIVSLEIEMSNAEYEDKYREALDAIRAHIIEQPYRTHDGVRAVHIDGRPYTDEAIFTKAWGKEAAAEIMREKPPMSR